MSGTEGKYFTVMIMLPEGTIFTRLPDSIDRVELRFLDAIRFGVESADLSYKRLFRQLLDVAKLDSEARIPASAYTEVMADAWSVVDAMHRLKELLERTPKLKGAGALNELRNSFHHAREDFLALAANHTAVWGIVAWCVPISANHGRVFNMVPGTLIGGDYAMLNPAGKVVEGPIDLITLTAFTRHANLTDLHRRMAKLVTYLEQAVGDRVAGMSGSICDVLVSMDARNEATE
jgi:hypothetical protein